MTIGKRSIMERFKQMFSRSDEDQGLDKIQVRLIKNKTDLLRIRKCQLNTVDFFLLHPGDSILGQKVFLYSMEKAHAKNPSVSAEQSIAWIAYSIHCDPVRLLPRGEPTHQVLGHFNRLTSIDLDEVEDINSLALHRDVQTRRICSLLSLTDYTVWNEDDRTIFVFACLRALLNSRTDSGCNYDDDFCRLFHEIHQCSEQRKLIVTFVPLFASITSHKQDLLQLVLLVRKTTGDVELGLQLVVEVFISFTQRAEFARERPSEKDRRSEYVTKLVKIIDEVLEDVITITKLPDLVRSVVRTCIDGEVSELCDVEVQSSLLKKL